MRIGNIILDTDSMTSKELTMIIKELRNIQTRKLKQEELAERMNALIEEAEKNQFAFISEETGRFWDKTTFTIADMA